MLIIIFSYQIILLPYFIYGIILGFVRIKIGLLYAILLHLVLNAPLLIKALVELKRA